MLACADIEEGIALRQAGVRAPILVFGALSVSDLDGIFAHELTPTISTPSAPRARCRPTAGEARRPHALSPEDRHRHEPARIPARQPPAHAAGGGRTRRTSRSTRSTRISRPPTTRITRRSRCSASASTQASALLPSLGIATRVRHAANSAALLRDERVWYDFVRPGLLLYGIVPPPLAVDADAATCPVTPQPYRGSEGPPSRRGHRLRPPHAGRSARPRSPSSRPGYADGLDLRLAGRGYMLVRGRRAPIVGSVCMDMTTIDVTGMDVAPGDEVVIVGEQGEESIGVREIAAAIGTIPYELLCRLGSRIQRVYG